MKFKARSISFQTMSEIKYLSYSKVVLILLVTKVSSTGDDTLFVTVSSIVHNLQMVVVTCRYS